MHSSNTLLTGKEDREVTTRESRDGLGEVKHILTVLSHKSFTATLLKALVSNPGHYVNASPTWAAVLKGLAMVVPAL